MNARVAINMKQWTLKYKDGIRTGEYVLSGTQDDMRDAMDSFFSGGRDGFEARLYCPDGGIIETRIKPKRKNINQKYKF